MAGDLEPVDGSLLPSGLSLNEVKLLQFWSDPLDDRSDMDVAKGLLISPARCRELRSDPRVVSYLSHALEAGIQASRPTIMKALTKNAVKKGDSNAQRMLLEIMGSYREQHEIHTTTRGIFVNLTDEELVDRVKKYHDEILSFSSEERLGKRVFGAAESPRRTYPAGPAGQSRRTRTRTSEAEGVE